MKLLSFVSAEKQQRIKDMKFSIDQKLTIYSEVLVRALACRLYGVKNGELSLPKIHMGNHSSQDFHDFIFSISHTRYAMFVVDCESTVVLYKTVLVLIVYVC